MQHKTKRNFWRSWTGLVALIAVVLGVTSSVWLVPLLSRSAKGFTVSQEMENLFAEQYLNDSDADSGITIRLLSFHSKANDTQVGEFIDYAVLNHSSENVSFPNAAYGLRIFSPDEIAFKWNELSTAFSLGNDENLLAQHTERTDHRQTTLSSCCILILKALFQINYEFVFLVLVSCLIKNMQRVWMRNEKNENLNCCKIRQGVFQPPVSLAFFQRPTTRGAT